MRTFTRGLLTKVAPEGERNWDVECLCSAETVDRSDEVLHQDGWNIDGFRSNPVMLACHRHALDDGHSPVIGKWTSMEVDTRGLVGRVKFADSELGEEYARLYKGGFMNAVSVGFMPIKTERRVDADGITRTHYLQQELYEVSAVAVGCNREATRLRTLLDKAAGVEGGQAGGGEVVTRADLAELGADLRGFIMQQVDQLLMVAGDKAAIDRLGKDLAADCCKGLDVGEEDAGEDDEYDLMLRDFDDRPTVKSGRDRGNDVGDSEHSETMRAAADRLRKLAESAE
jgi:HK97 family phage prohead protease